jgi:hypothetical protein
MLRKHASSLLVQLIKSDLKLEIHLSMTEPEWNFIVQNHNKRERKKYEYPL